MKIIREQLSNGAYSLYNGWVKVPSKEKIPDEIDVKEEVQEYTDRQNKCDTVEKIDQFIDDLYKLRQEGLLKSGEYGKENLIFKEIRNTGVLNKLKDKKVELENEQLSLK